MPKKAKATTKKAVKKSAATAKPKRTAAKSKNVNAKYFAAVGRRKSAVARVRIMKGTGKITVNEKDMKSFFPDEHWQRALVSPLVLTGNLKTLDISIITRGGGVNGQAHAARHGIARALEKLDADLRGTLKKAGYLTRDSRAKERKKYGLKRARRAPQFSKR